MKRIKTIKIIMIFLSLHLLFPIHLKAATESDAYLGAKENVLGINESDTSYDVNDDGNTDVLDVVRIKQDLLTLSERIGELETNVETLEKRIDNIENQVNESEQDENAVRKQVNLCYT